MLKPKEDMNFITVKMAVNRLRKAFKEDDNYRYGWVANIAVCMQDAYASAKNKKDIHTISNDGAERFIKLLEK